MIPDRPTATRNGYTWPIDPDELYVGIQDRVAELAQEMARTDAPPDTTPLVDAIWDLLHAVRFPDRRAA